MSLSDAVRRMVTLGIMEHRIPIEITREPEVAGIGMSDEDAKYYGAPKDDTDGRNGITCGISIKMPPQDKKAMRE